MSYRAAKIVLKDGRVSFKVLYEKTQDGVRRARGVNREEWGQLGLTPKMTLEQARARCSELNKISSVKRVQEARLAIKDRLAEKDAVAFAYLPQELLREFEEEHLFRRLADRQRDKAEVWWRAAKSMLCDVQVEPYEWEFKAERFYEWFKRKQYSLSYVQKILRLTNRWGRFLTFRAKVPVAPIPFPTGSIREEIADANYEKPVKRGNKESAPLNWELLRAKQSKLTPEHYNWIYLALWCGLRPHEIDNLHKGADFFRIDEQNGIKVLWVYQTKLKRSVKRSERWKYIPLFLPEQERIPEMIRSGKFKQPRPYVLHEVFGKEYGAYLGRKGFYTLMRSRGQDGDHIQVWLGHKKFDTTFESYVDKRTVAFTPIPKRAA